MDLFEEVADEFDDSFIQGSKDYDFDIEAQQQDSQSQAQAAQLDAKAQIPDNVRKFIHYFYRNYQDNNVYELHNIYDNSFNKLSDQFFQKQQWPDAETVASMLSLKKLDDVFLMLYRELYYRHIYARLKPTVEQRIGSYQNYCHLFNYILSSDEPVPLELPTHWLWDMIDEFIYQFQSFHNYSPAGDQADEIAQLKEKPHVWSCYSVIQTLHALVEKSRINEQLAIIKSGGDMAEAAGKFGSRPLYKMLGYFSVVGLLRVHCLLGDYTMALKTMDNTMLNKKLKFARVAACHVTTCYYVGFAYLMMRRYADAIKVFSSSLSFIQRMKQFHSRSSHFDQVAKKADQMYALLAICIALCPTRLDENIHSQLREKYSEHLVRMQKGDDLTVYKKLWQFGSPKFVFVSATQEQVFMSDILNQLKLPALRSFMKLYTSMGVDKLAKFLDMDVEELKVHLLTLKQKSRQYKWSSGDLLEGEYTTTSDLDFCLKQDVLHIAESKVGRRYADWFLRNINRCEDILVGLAQQA